MSYSGKFKEKLTSKETVNSLLTDREISVKDYEPPVKVKDCHNLYLKCDILLLDAVFEKFRSNSLKTYELCPGHYLNAPALNWDDMPGQYLRY